MPHGLNTLFDRVAALYDQARPRYPTALIDDVVAWSGIAPGGSILEIGCGPGTATLPFARRGYTMLCLELGAGLARLAAARCAPYPGVRVEHVAFEDWPVQREAFDLVICAEAFHWLSPALRFVNTAAALVAGGALALFWNGHPRLAPDLAAALQPIYAHHAPRLLPQEATAPEEVERLTVAGFDESGLFGPVRLGRYPWCHTYTPEGYLDLLRTYAPVQGLPQRARERLLDDVRLQIERHGGIVPAEYLSRLYVAAVR